jgi:hypothetical protein
MLWPKGSGSGADPAHVIAIDAYGSGKRPVVLARPADAAALKLFNQQYWNVADLEIVGGRRYGLQAGGDDSIRPLHHIWLHDDAVHDSLAAAAAMICVCQGGYGFDRGFDGVRIERLQVYSSFVGDGIFVSGTDVAIRNNLVYGIGGSGMWVGGGTDVVMESNVVHDVGQYAGQGGVIGIWEWLCTRCVVQDNEVWNTTSGDLTDGGTFDVDYNNVDNTVQYNYGHDSDGYCVAIFGATDVGLKVIVTTNTIVRYNICADTGLGPAHHQGYNPEGSIHLETWNDGKLDGVQVYNNTFVAAPASPVGAFDEVPDVGENRSVAYTGSLPNVFANNVVYSYTAPMIFSWKPSAMTFDHNDYFYVGPRSKRPTWTFRGARFADFAAYQGATSQDAHGLNADPLLANPTYHDVPRPTTQFVPKPGSPLIDAGEDVCAGRPRCSNGGRDFAGTKVPQGAAYDIGAMEVVQGGLQRALQSGARRASSSQATADDAERGHPSLLTFFTPEAPRARDQAMVLASMQREYGKTGLVATLVDVSRRPLQRRVSVAEDWNVRAGGLSALVIDASFARSFGVTRLPTTLLADGHGQIVARWDGYASPAAVSFALRGLVAIRRSP